MMESSSSKDFFISYTKVDEEWAEWIAWQLEAMGHTTLLQAWDFKPGENFVVKMQEATTKTKRTIAVLSREYFEADFTEPEWAAAFAEDPKGNKGKLLLIKVKSVEIPGLLNQIIPIELINLSEKEAKKRLLERFDPSDDGIRNKPHTQPFFPGTKPESSQTNQEQIKSRQIYKAESNPSDKKNNLEESPEFKAGLADKDNQAKHVFKWTGEKFIGKDKKSTSHSAFLLYGADSQWPYALIHILYNQIKTLLNSDCFVPFKLNSPEPVLLNGRIYGDDISPATHLWKLVAEKLTCSPQKKDIESKLGDKTVPNILYRPLISDESSNPELVIGMLEAWEKLELPSHSPRHILILFYEHSDKAKSRWSMWSKKNDSLIDKIKTILSEQVKAKSLLPEISSPTTKEIEDWIKNLFIPGDVQEVKDFIEDQINAKYLKHKNDKKYAHRICITDHGIEIHHHDLKSILIDALTKFG